MIVCTACKRAVGRLGDLHECSAGAYRFAMEVEEMKSNNPFRKQSGGKLSPVVYALVAVVFGAALSLSYIGRKPAPADNPAPYGYLVVDYAYKDGVLVRPFVIDAGVDKATCVAEAKEWAEGALAEPDMPSGVTIIAACVPMPKTPSASSAPRPAPPVTRSTAPEQTTV